MKVLYFAWLRERIGVAEEEVAPPPEVLTIADLAAWLAQKHEGYARAFENPTVVQAALDHQHVKPSALIAGAREIAFFPLMTGG